VIDGSPHFIGEFPYWGEIPQQQMRDINRNARAGAWNAALVDSQDAAIRRAADMILNLDRANWQWLLPLSPESRVLDVGAGTGTTSHALARRYREVVAIEPVLERVQFMQHRFGQEHLSNVTVVRTSLGLLPFAPASFDLVAMNGVLEWVPEGQSGDPRALQLAALANAYRLLRPGGYLYLGIENRFVPGYFFGYSDPHCGLPFVTVLPRRLARWYAKRKGQAGYRNYLYSSRGYRKLLLDAGFSRVDIYLALPSYNHPRFFLPLDANVHHYYSRNFDSSRSSRLRVCAQEILLRLRLLRYCEYSFAIFARK
jgi:SAM-dependent methyltransferase